MRSEARTQENKRNDNQTERGDEQMNGWNETKRKTEEKRSMNKDDYCEMEWCNYKKGKCGWYLVVEYWHRRPYNRANVNVMANIKVDAAFKRVGLRFTACA